MRNMSRTKLIRLFKHLPPQSFFVIFLWLSIGIIGLLFFVSDYSKNILITRKSLYTALQGSPDQALEIYSTLTRQNRLFSSQDYLAFRLSSQSVDLRSAFLKNPTNLAYLVLYSDQIHSSRDWEKTGNYFQQLTFARFMSSSSLKYANSRDPQEAKKGLFFMILTKKTLDDYLTNNQLGTLFNNRYKAYQKGVPLLEESLQFRPRQTETYGYLGDLYSRMKRHPLGRSYYILSLRLNPTLFQAYLQISQSLIQEEKYAEALSYLVKAQQLIPNNINQTAQLAVLFARSGNETAGERIFKAYIRKHPDQAEPRYRFGLFLKEYQQKQDAFNQFSLSLALDPAYEKSYWERAGLLIEQTDWIRALEDLDKAIALNPTHQGYQNRRQWVEKQLVR